MLAGTGLGDDAALLHAPGNQDLAHAIVDLMGAGMVQLIALQIDLGAGEVIGQALGEEQRTGPADVMLEVIVELGLEFRVGLAGVVGLLDLEHEGHEGLGDESPAIKTETPALIRPAAETVGFAQDLLPFRRAAINHC